MEFEVAQLDNGIKIIHQQTFSTNIAHIGLMIDVGSRDELDHEHGMAHFIEHVIFKGTNKRSAKQILSRLDAVGGEINAFTGKEDTVIYASVLKEHYNRAAELISDILVNSTFPEAELTKEKEVIYDEINYYLDTPSEQIFDDFEKQLFEDYSIGRNILGTKEKLDGFNQQMIKDFIKRNYTTNRMVISSVGPFSFKQAKSVIERYFSSIPSSTSTRSKQSFAALSKQDLILKRDVMQSHQMIGLRAYDQKHRNKAALTLVSNYLGGPAMNSRFNLEVREKRGFTYNIESNYSPFTDTGIFSVYFGTDSQNVNATRNIILKELKKLRSKSIGSRTLHSAKKQLIGQLSLAQENKASLMLALAKSFLIHDRVDSIEEVVKKIESISEEQIFELANELFKEDLIHSLTYQA
ncbi:insulinase family protein [Flavobacteriales bacterium]|nr:insulinase family protein [Flavobacteriales bacterium]